MMRAKHDNAERGQKGENNKGCTLMCADGYRRRRVARWSGRGYSCVLICIHIICGNAKKVAQKRIFCEEVMGHANYADI